MRRPLKFVGWIVFLLALILLSALCVLVFGRADEGFKAYGFTKPAAFEKVKAGIGGTIEEVLVKEGDEVEEGDTLVILRQDELLLQSAQARQELDGAETKLAELVEDYEDLRSSDAAEIGLSLTILLNAQKIMEVAKKQYDRACELHTAALTSDEDLEQARLNYELSQSNFHTLELKLDLLKSRYCHRIDEAEKRVAVAKTACELAEERLNKAVVLAPISGVVMTPNLNELAGITVSEGQALMEIGDLSEMNFIVKIDEIHVPEVQVGQRVRVTINAFPHRRYRVFSGELVHISQKPEVTPKGVAFEARIEIAEPWVDQNPSKLHLKPGLSGEAKIITKQDVKLIEMLLGMEKG